jgi:hypothetical protein
VKCATVNCFREVSGRYTFSPYCDKCSEYLLFRLPDKEPMSKRFRKWVRWFYMTRWGWFCASVTMIALLLWAGTQGAR